MEGFTDKRKPMNGKLEKFLVSNKSTVKEAIKRMDDTGEKILFAVDANDKLCGAITDGDIRRWILKEGSISENIARMYNASPQMVHEHYDEKSVRKMMISKRIGGLPVVDKNHHVVDIIFATDLLSGHLRKRKSNLNVPVLVMAGGKGTRLDPFTKILPKPLIPLGDKPIVEVIMDRFAEFGCHDFYLTVNYKGKMIQSYFDNSDCKHNIHYVWEDVPYGTGGSIRLAAPKIKAPHIFISNCDIMIKGDYNDIFNFHTSKKNDITIIGSMQHVSVPYGVLEMRNGGILHDIIEKPEYDLLVNTGFYLIKREVIKLIPKNTKFDFTDLIKKVKQQGGNVGIYPVSQQSWVDIGQWQEYHNAIKALETSL